MALDPRVRPVILGAACAAAGHLAVGLVPSAGPFQWMPLLLAAALGALVLARLGWVDRLRAAERATGRSPSWPGRLGLYAVVGGETLLAFRLGRLAFWAWFAAAIWSWLLYRGLLARRPALARLVPYLLLALAGAGARLG